MRVCGATLWLCVALGCGARARDPGDGGSAHGGDGDSDSDGDGDGDGGDEGDGDSDGDGDGDGDGGDDGDADSDGSGDADGDGDADLSVCGDAPGPWEMETPDPEAFGWGALGVSADSTLSIVYMGWDYSTRFATRGDDGWTFELIPVDSHGTSLEPPVFDEGGSAHLSFRQGSGEVQYATNVTGTWTAEQVGFVADQDGVAFSGRSRVALAPDGSARVVYSDFAGLWVASFEDGAWSLEDIPDGDPTWYHAAATSSDGVLHVAWITMAWELRHASRSGGEWLVQTLDDDLGDVENMLLNMTVTPQLSFHDDSLVVAYHAIGELRSVSISPDGQATAGSRVDTAPFDERSLSFVLEPPSRWHVSYVSNETDIRYATACEDGWTDESVEETPLSAGPEMWAPLTLGPEAVPVIVFFGSAIDERVASSQPKVLILPER